MNNKKTLKFLVIFLSLLKFLLGKKIAHHHNKHKHKHHHYHQIEQEIKANGFLQSHSLPYLDLNKILNKNFFKTDSKIDNSDSNDYIDSDLKSKRKNDPKKFLLTRKNFEEIRDNDQKPKETICKNDIKIETKKTGDNTELLKGVKENAIEIPYKNNEETPNINDEIENYSKNDKFNNFKNNYHDENSEDDRINSKNDVLDILNKNNLKNQCKRNNNLYGLKYRENEELPDEIDLITPVNFSKKTYNLCATEENSSEKIKDDNGKKYIDENCHNVAIAKSSNSKAVAKSAGEGKAIAASDEGSMASAVAFGGGSAVSQARNDGRSTAIAYDLGHSTAKSFGGTAEAISKGNGKSLAISSDNSYSRAIAIGNSNSTALSSENAVALSKADSHSLSEADSKGNSLSFANSDSKANSLAIATDDSFANSTAYANSVALSTASNNSTACSNALSEAQAISKSSGNGYSSVQANSNSQAVAESKNDSIVIVEANSLSKALGDSKNKENINSSTAISQTNLKTLPKEIRLTTEDKKKINAFIMIKKIELPVFRGINSEDEDERNFLDYLTITEDTNIGGIVGNNPILSINSNETIINKENSKSQTLSTGNTQENKTFIEGEKKDEKKIQDIKNCDELISKLDNKNNEILKNLIINVSNIGINPQSFEIDKAKLSEVNHIDGSKFDSKNEFVKDLIKKINNEECLLNYNAGPVFNTNNEINLPIPNEKKNEDKKENIELPLTSEKINKPEKNEIIIENQDKNCEIGKKLSKETEKKDRKSIENNVVFDQNKPNKNGSFLSGDKKDLAEFIENLKKNQGNLKTSNDSKENANEKNKNEEIDKNNDFVKTFPLGKMNFKFDSNNNKFNNKNFKIENYVDYSRNKVNKNYKTEDSNFNMKNHVENSNCNNRGKHHHDYDKHKKYYEIGDDNDFNRRRCNSFDEEYDFPERRKRYDFNDYNEDEKRRKFSDNEFDHDFSDQYLKSQMDKPSPNKEDDDYKNENFFSNKNFKVDRISNEYKEPDKVIEALERCKRNQENNLNNKKNIDNSLKLHSIWTKTDFKAIDIACSNRGDIMVIGDDKKLYKYQINSNQFKPIKQEGDISNLKNVDLGMEATPFVVTQNGNTYFLNFEMKWIRLPGCANQISVGKNGEIFKLGCTKHHRGFSIYQLTCFIDEKNKEEIKSKNRKIFNDDEDNENDINYKKHYSCENEKCKHHSIKKKLDFYLKNYFSNLKCAWKKFPGFGKILVVGNDGYPYVISNKNNFVYKYDGTDWDAVSGIKAKDVSISNENILFIAGLDGKIYKTTNEKEAEVSIFDDIDAEKISTGPYSQPSIIKSKSGLVYTSSKI